jgi:hypothetical protein
MDEKTVDYSAIAVVIIAISVLWGWLFDAWSSDYITFFSYEQLLLKGACGAGLAVLMLFLTNFIDWISSPTDRVYITGAIYGFCAGVVLSFSSGILIFPLRWYVS